MEILFASALLFIALAIAARRCWSPAGWVNAWCALLGLSACFRFLIEWMPASGPAFGYALTLSVAGALAAKSRFPKFRENGLLALPWILALLFLLARSYFPQFDVDSLEYHLVGIRWLQDRHTLTALQQHPEAITNWICVIGFEEFLSLPGLVGDLPLAAGLVGGVLKAVTLLSILSMIPRPAALLRYACFFLLLIDDHFFFSGQSTWVYLNPSLIGIVALLSWSAGRGLRGHSESAWQAGALSFGLVAVKYYGLFFMPLAAFSGLYCFAVRRHLRTPTRDTTIALAGALAGFLAVVVFHGLQSGYPFHPMGTAQAEHFYRGQEALQHYFYGGSVSRVLRNPLHNLIFPGALVMKMVAVLILPTFALFLISLLQAAKKRFSVDKRALQFSALCFLVAIAWTFTADVIYQGESRYPRYSLGVCILGVCYLAISFRKLGCQLAAATGLRVPSGRSKVLVIAFGYGALLWLFATIDTRYVNVGPASRPHWRNIVELAKAKAQGAAYSLDLAAPYTQGLFMPYVAQTIPPLRACLEDLEAQSGLQLTKGKGLAIGASYQNWPSFLIANNAVELGFTEGGGYLRLPGGASDLRRLGIEYVIMRWYPPTNGYLETFVRKGIRGELEPVSVNPRPLCTGGEMHLLRLAP